MWTHVFWTAGYWGAGYWSPASAAVVDPAPTSDYDATVTGSRFGATVVALEDDEDPP